MRIRDGSIPLVDTDARNPLTIALLELTAGKIHPERAHVQAEEQKDRQETRAGEQAAER
jgi:DNA-directed RNA polymerase subunit K/omega